MRLCTVEASRGGLLACVALLLLAVWGYVSRATVPSRHWLLTEIQVKYKVPSSLKLSQCIVSSYLITLQGHKRKR